MIHQVNIKSLPQEWLWCETWCSDAEKLNAKTIDLVSKYFIYYVELFWESRLLSCQLSRLLPC